MLENLLISVACTVPEAGNPALRRLHGPMPLGLLCRRFLKWLYPDRVKA